MISTVYERESEISYETAENARKLISIGVDVQFDVDAEKLDSSYKNRKFDCIIFQFPNVASRRAKYNRNPNHILIRRFLKACVPILSEDSRIIISVVDSPYYEGAFSIEEAAAEAGYECVVEGEFNLGEFPEYQHQNTLDNGSAIDSIKDFSSYIIIP